MFATCQKFGDLYLFGLLWQYSSVQTKYNKGRSKSWLLTCRSNITLSLPSYTGSALKRELIFCSDYLSLLYFCFRVFLSFFFLLFFQLANFYSSLNVQPEIQIVKGIQTTYIFLNILLFFLVSGYLHVLTLALFYDMIWC